MVIPVQELKEAPVQRTPRPKKPMKMVRVERTKKEWKKIIEEAKRKEGFWTKGILPASVHMVNVAVAEEIEED